MNIAYSISGTPAEIEEFYISLKANEFAAAKLTEAERQCDIAAAIDAFIERYNKSKGLLN